MVSVVENEPDGEFWIHLFKWLKVFGLLNFGSLSSLSKRGTC